METEKVVEVFAPARDGGKNNFGSGYLVSETLVLTAAHVVDGSRGCEARPLGEKEWLSAEEVWRGADCDAALLRVPARGVARPPRFGELTSAERTRCQALGFPLAQERAGKRPVRDTEEVSGEIAPLSGLKSGRLTVHIAGSVPSADKSGHSPWEGISGAALFVDALIVAIIVIDPRNFGTDRLEALPVASLADDPGFRDVFRRESGREFALEVDGAGAAGRLPAETAVTNFLHQYLGDAKRVVPFAGRERDLAHLDDWLDDPDRPYLLITGPPGRGKSALLARWWQRLGERDASDVRSVFVPISIRYGLNREEAVLKAIVARLASALGDDSAATAISERSTEDLREQLGALLSRSPPAGRRTVLILDGLDEAAGWAPGPSFFPARPADRVKVVTSARLTGSHSSDEDWLSELGWEDDTASTITVEALSVEGTRAVVETAGPKIAPLAAEAGMVERLHAASDGDPLVLSLYLRQLSSDAAGDPRDAVADMRPSEPGLAGFMERWWKDQEPGTGRRDPAVATIFNLLACAIGPLERRDLLALAKRRLSITGDELEGVIAVLDRIVVRESPTSYALSHPRIGEYRMGQLEADDELDEYEGLFAGWGRDTLSALRDGKLLPSAAPAYLVRHYREHLDRIRRTQGSSPDAAVERYLEMVVPSWLRAWEAVGDGSGGYVDDVEAALRVAGVADAEAVAKGEAATFVADEIWCSFVRAEQASTLTLVAGALMAELVKHGVWSERRALAAWDEIEQPWTRAEALTTLAPHMGAQGLRQLAARLPDLADAEEEFERAVAEVALDMARADSLSAAYAFAESQEPGRGRAAAILGLLPVAPAEERAALLESAREDFDGPPMPDELLSRLTTVVDLDLAREVFGDRPADALIDRLRGRIHWWLSAADLDELDGVSRAYALSYLGHWLPAEEVEAEVAATLRQMELEGISYNVDEAMESLAPFLRGDLFQRALAVIDGLLTDSQSQLLAWVALLDAADERERERLLGLIVSRLEEIMTFGIPSETTDALAALARHGAAETCLEEVAKLSTSSWNKAAHLAALAPHLDREGVRRGFSIARQTRHGTGEVAVKALLARLASFGQAEAKEALGLASAYEKSDEMTAAVAVLSQVAQRRLDLAELLAIKDGALRLGAIAVSSRAATPTASDLLEALLSYQHGSDPLDPLALDLFDEMRRELPDEEIRGNTATRALADVVKRGLHPRKDELIVSYMRQLAGIVGSSATIALGERLSSPDFDPPLAWAVVAAGGHARDEEEVAALQRAASSISSHLRRAAAKASLLSLEPSDQREAAALALVEPVDPAEIEQAPRSAALLLNSLPSEYREQAAHRLVPNELLDGASSFALSTTWGEQIADLARALEPDQVRRLRDASSRVNEYDVRSKIRAAVATRIGALGHFEEAAEDLTFVDSEGLAEALHDLVGVVPASEVPGLIEIAVERLPAPWSREKRARVWTVASRRLPELSPERQLRLLQWWLERKPSRDEILVDMLLFAPVIASLGGVGAAEELSRRLSGSE